MTKSRGILKRVQWTNDQIQYVRERYPHDRAADIAQHLGVKVQSIYVKARALNLVKSPEFFASEMSGRTNGTKGMSTRFSSGQASWNKGQKLPNHPRNATQFKKGCVPKNALPVGFIRKNTDGYMEIKTAPGMRKWVPLSHWNWKLAHGEYPPKGTALLFRDGNHENCDISNLEVVTNQDLMKKNSLHNYPKEITTLIQLRGALNRRINRLVKNHE